MDALCISPCVQLSQGVIPSVLLCFGALFPHCALHKVQLARRHPMSLSAICMGPAHAAHVASFLLVKGGLSRHDLLLSLYLLGECMRRSRPRAEPCSHSYGHSNC